MLPKFPLDQSIELRVPVSLFSKLLAFEVLRYRPNVKGLTNLENIEVYPLKCFDFNSSRI